MLLLAAVVGNDDASWRCMRSDAHYMMEVCVGWCRVVRGIRYERQNLQIAMEVFGMWWERVVWRGIWGGRYNSPQTEVTPQNESC